MEYWKRIVAALVAIAAGVVYASHAHGGAPAVKTQAPGYYRMMLGDFEVTALSDGVVALPMDKLLTNVKPERVEQMLRRAHLASPVPTSVNAYLINTGSKLVLIDSGAGNLFGPTLGNLVTNLKAAGYQPEQVDEIYITHMHGDHVGGLAANGGLVFPNAIVRADQRDADFWLSQAAMDQAPADKKPAFQGAMAMLSPYVAAGKFKPFDGATELVPGVVAEPAYGHTPGHTVYRVESKGQKMVVLGDLMHVAAVQFAHPQVTISFDTDAKRAAAARAKVYADAARHGVVLAIAHGSFPGLGYIRPEGSGYVYTPVNYTVPR
jgi:glyoxylase-like metal-dependent hydrolase (beta-lactamase superfamily II)